MYTKVSLLLAFILVHKFDIISLSETYFNSKTSPGMTVWKYLDINFIREDCTSNSK